MGPREDTKTTEAIRSIEVVPDLGNDAATSRERISAYFTMAAAAFGFLNDGWAVAAAATTAADTTTGAARLGGGGWSLSPHRYGPVQIRKDANVDAREKVQHTQ
ncbi:hypothetical protein BC827DRAFT_304651 [Russula dissimulans]|nr:hypothetical protein BC827DRAFT_304651 [Russula dissimulans]